MPSKQLCVICNLNPAALKRPKNGNLICRECFFEIFENEIHSTIASNNLFVKGDCVACGASGGKDSTVLMHLMKTLNDRHNYGIKLVLVSIDEGIAGYRDDSLETVHRNSKFYDIPLHIFSYKELYGWTMDEIVKTIGTRNNCTFCGVFRRQALDRGAILVGANKIVTGHNADDTAETVLMNILRSDVPRLTRCTNVMTTSEEGEQVPRVKPLKYAYEKEIVLYAHFKKLDYFTTECTYSKEAFRGNVRTLIKELEAVDPRCISDIITSGEDVDNININLMKCQYGESVTAEESGQCTPSKAISDGTSIVIANKRERDGLSLSTLTDVNTTSSEIKCEDKKCFKEGEENDFVSNLSEFVKKETFSIVPKGGKAKKCVRCGYITSQQLCRACALLDSLKSGNPLIALHR